MIRVPGDPWASVLGVDLQQRRGAGSDLCQPRGHCTAAPAHGIFVITILPDVMGYLDLTRALQVFFQWPFKLSLSSYWYWPFGPLLSQQARSPPLSQRASRALYIFWAQLMLYEFYKCLLFETTFHLNICMIKSPQFHIPTAPPCLRLMLFVCYMESFTHPKDYKNFFFPLQIFFSHLIKLELIIVDRAEVGVYALFFPHI